MHLSSYVFVLVVGRVKRDFTLDTIVHFNTHLCKRLHPEAYSCSNAVWKTTHPTFRLLLAQLFRGISGLEESEEEDQANYSRTSLIRRGRAECLYCGHMVELSVSWKYHVGASELSANKGRFHCGLNLTCS